MWKRDRKCKLQIALFPYNQLFGVSWNCQRLLNKYLHLSSMAESKQLIFPSRANSFCFPTNQTAMRRSGSVGQIGERTEQKEEGKQEMKGGTEEEARAHPSRLPLGNLCNEWCQEARLRFTSIDWGSLDRAQELSFQLSLDEWTDSSSTLTRKESLRPSLQRFCLV